MPDLVSMGATCLGLTLAGTLIGFVFGIGVAFAVGWLGARPVLRWGLGQAEAAGCLAIGVLVTFGGFGGAWSGLGGGAAWCAHEAVNRRLLLEDLAISAVVIVATENQPCGDLEDDAAAIQGLVERTGGSLEALLGDIEAEILAEEPTAEIPEFLTPEVVPKLIEALDDHELFDPSAMAAIHSGDGVASARSEGDARTAAYAQRLVEAFEPVRREVWLGILATAVSNAVLTMVGALFVPMLLIALIAAVARVLRRSGSSQPVPPPPARPVA